MSAIRNTGAHRAHRSSQLPYSRPPVKKSTWSFTGLLNYLNPLRSRSSVDIADPSVDSDDDEETPSRQDPFAAQSLSARGHQMSQGIHTHGGVNALAGPSSQFHQPSVTQPLEPPATPVRSNVPHPFQHSPSPSRNIEVVSNFLSERAGKSVSNSEVEGLIALLQQSTPPKKPEPFRFSSRHSTPVRENSPFLPSTNGITYSVNTLAPQTPTPSPRKTLSRNPNGVYRWEGVGSAKAARSRNRYSSPAFGPPRPSSDRLVLKDNQTASEGLKTDAKRRKIGEEAQSSSYVTSGASSTDANGSTLKIPSRSSAPGPSPERIAQAFPFPVSSSSPVASRPSVANSSLTPQINGPSPAPRLRTPARPTAPVVPSPLRQAWSGSSSSSHIDSPPQAPQKQTKAANFMTDLIKEVTPPKRPDLSNPYQTASPVGKVALPKARVGKRTRATGKPAVPPAPDSKSKVQLKPTEKEKECTPQAIIEATLPKGSKRSRPPSYFEKPSPSTPDVSRLPLASDISPGSPPRERHFTVKEPSRATYVVEEMNDDEESERSKPYSNGEPKSTVLTPEIVIEEMDESDAQTLIEPPVVTTTPTNIFGVSGSGATKLSARALFPGFKPTLPKEPSKLRFSYQPEVGKSSPVPAPAVSLADPPSQSVHAVTQTTNERERKIQSPKKTPKEAALALPVDALPTFVFSVTATLTSASTLSHLKALEEAKLVPKSSLPAFDFSLPTRNSNADAPKPVSPPIKAFDWAAAGMKEPAKASGGGGDWMCSTCMLSNPATTVDKCGICEAPR